jgi:hypothetical protein
MVIHLLGRLPILVPLFGERNVRVVPVLPVAGFVTAKRSRIACRRRSKMNRIRMLAPAGRAGAAGVDAEASISVHAANEISLNSTVPLAFAVELYELLFNLETAAVQLRKTAVAVQVRGERRTVTRERLVPA